MKYWIGVASKEHVTIGVNGGFCQLCHGKASPLKRMKKGDFILYYSSKIKMSDTTPYQQFTAIGQLIDDNIYPYRMNEDFIPYRRDINFFDARPMDIRPLIERLDFISNKKRWGYPFRYGHLSIGKKDFLTIASYMLDAPTFAQLQEDTQ